MISKDETDQLISQIISGMRTASLSLILPSFYPRIRDRYTTLLANCLDLQLELAATSDDKGLVEVQKKVFAFEEEYRRIRRRLLLIPYVVWLYGGFAGLFYGVRFLDIPGFLRTTLGVERSDKLISLGIAGAFVYLATSLLSRLESGGPQDAQLAAIANFGIRLSLAIVVPIVLVVLFFTKDGQISEIKITPELLSFACGYSAKLVVDVFNKIVEKGSTMIQAL